MPSTVTDPGLQGILSLQKFFFKLHFGSLIPIRNVNTLLQFWALGCLDLVEPCFAGFPMAGPETRIPTKVVLLSSAKKQQEGMVFLFQGCLLTSERLKQLKRVVSEQG